MKGQHTQTSHSNEHRPMQKQKDRHLMEKFLTPVKGDFICSENTRDGNPEVHVTGYGGCIIFLSQE